MLEREIMGETIWECDTAEAKALWKSHPADRWRLWDHAEVDAHILSDPATLSAAIAAKKAKPGKLAGISASPPLPATTPAPCGFTGKYCSETPCAETCE